MNGPQSVTIFGQGTILEPTTPHIGREVALVARTAALVYIYARISQIAEIHRSFCATQSICRLGIKPIHVRKELTISLKGASVALFVRDSNRADTLAA